MNTIKKTTLLDRLRNAINAFRGKPIGSIEYGISVKKCLECDYIHYHEVLQMVYRDLVNYHHNGADIDFDDMIGSLGHVLDD